jgi:hypothetical protein
LRGELDSFLRKTCNPISSSRAALCGGRFCAPALGTTL